MDKFKMINYRIRIILLVVFSVFFVSYITYSATATLKNDKIQTALEQHIHDLQTHYEILLYHQNITAETVYSATLEMPRFIEIYSQIHSSTKEKQSILRKELQKLLTNIYKRIQRKGVLQYHFILPNNVSFLRMHKVDKFGDDLSSVRRDFKFVNETKSRMRGYIQGRTAHGFRNVFPIFDHDGKHLGAMEVSFSSDEFIKYLTYVSKIHTHFLVDKKILKSSTLLKTDSILVYENSDEHKDFMVSMSNEHSAIHCLSSSKIMLEDFREDINKGIEKGDKFSILLNNDTRAQAVSFLPIKGLDGDKTLAWFVSYVNDTLIYATSQNSQIVRMFLFILYAFIGYLSYKNIMAQRERILRMKKRADIDSLTGIYNRNKFDRVFRYELIRNERYKRELSLAIIDIDHFKIFNDTYGHLIGDEVLIMLVRSLEKHIRDTDIFARWGGEEFVILFPETNSETAREICEKLRVQIELLQHPKAGGINASFGVSSYKKRDTQERMFKRCDDALYEAKESGRNRVVVR